MIRTDAVPLFPRVLGEKRADRFLRRAAAAAFGDEAGDESGGGDVEAVVRRGAAGRGNEDFCTGADFCHHATLGWPGTTGFDFSIAVYLRWRICFQTASGIFISISDCFSPRQT